MLEQIIGMISGAYNTVFAQIWALIPPGILAFYQANRAACLLGIICILMLFALEGYKIFKMAMYVGSAFLFGYFGMVYFAPLLPQSVTSFIPAGIQVNVIVALVCALVAIFLTRCAYDFMIMLLGGALGYLLGSTVLYNLLLKYFHTLDFLKLPAVKHVVGGAIAAVVAILFILLFKHLFMILTSFGCTVAAALVLQNLVMPGAEMTIKVAFAIFGFALGIYCVVRQYRQEEKDMEIVF